MRQLRLLLAVLILGCGSFPTTPLQEAPAVTPTRVAPTTVLVYMNGSDLENSVNASASQNLREALAAPYPEGIPFVFCTGGSRQENGDGPVRSWRTVKRHHMLPGRLQELTDLGPISMDDPQTLVDFIRWGAAAYPARRYLLILWDHGAAYQGFGGDKVNPVAGQAQMSQAQLVRAIGEGSGSIGTRFELIGFDACLMASDEVSQGLAPFGRVMVASQELEPGTGWDWNELVATLARKPDIAGPELGKVIADSYLVHAAANAPRPNLTCSVLDLDAEAALSKALGALASALRAIYIGGDLAAIESALAAQLNAYSFGSVQTVDVIDWMEQLERQGLLLNEARAVREACSRTVLYSARGPAAPGAHGLSVFVPRAVLDSERRAQYARVVYLEPFLSMVESIYAWAQSETGQLSVDNLVYSGGQLAFRVTSRLGVGNVRLAISADPPSASVVRFLDVSNTQVPAQKSLQPVELTLPVTGATFTWDGHPIVLPRDFRQTSEHLKVYDMNSRVNGQSATIQIVADDSSGTTVYQVGDYTLDEEFDRSDPVLPGDIIQSFSTQFDRADASEQRLLLSEFPAGSRQIRLTPLQPGSYYLYVLVQDLELRRQLSSETILLP